MNSEASPALELVELRFAGTGGIRYRASLDLEPGTRLLALRFAGVAWPASSARLRLQLRDGRTPLEREVVDGILDEQRMLAVEDVDAIDAYLVVKHPRGDGGSLTVGLLLARPRVILAACELGADAPEGAIRG